MLPPSTTPPALHLQETHRASYSLGTRTINHYIHLHDEAENFLCIFTTTTSCSPPPLHQRHPSPGASSSPGAPTDPTNVIKILKKAGQFKTLIRLLKSTQLDSNLNSQLGNTNNGLTIFAPSDSAFSSLKKGTINSLTRQQKVELVQFHIIPTFIPISRFDTVTNPLNTHAGSGGRFQLNVTSAGNTVNLATGLTNTTVSDNVYIANRLAIYKVDKVLLPLDVFTPKPPAPAPVKAKVKEIAESPDEEEENDDDDGTKKNVSAAVRFGMHYSVVVSLGIGVVAIVFAL